MNWFFEYVLILVAAVFVLPIVVYLCAKMGAAGYFRSKQIFDTRPTLGATITKQQLTNIERN